MLGAFFSASGHVLVLYYFGNCNIVFGLDEEELALG